MASEVVFCSQCNTLFQTDEAATVCPGCGQGLPRAVKFALCSRCDTSFWVDIDATRVMCPSCGLGLPPGTLDWQDAYLEEVTKPIPSGGHQSEKGDRTHSRMRAMRAKLAKFKRQFRYIWYD